MTRTDYRLLAALALSLALHALPFLADGLAVREPAEPIAPPLLARLREPTPPPVPAPPPPLEMPEPATSPAAPKPKPAAEKPRDKPAPKATNWTQTVRRHLEKLNDAGQFYPPEAIARGLEGEALVLIVIAPSGQVVAARLEESSGHRLLDEAALRAVRSLKSLPADAPREALLPVRFRLR
ncbi:MAG: energy transducer TonB [Betaproteobacteria bacterium]|nr:energy transducer TonB [Betaproteobacteria bacterium]